MEIPRDIIGEVMNKIDDVDISFDNKDKFTESMLKMDMLRSYRSLSTGSITLNIKMVL